MIWGYMDFDISKFRGAYNQQKANARTRNIEFLLTFQEWTNFWGDDITKRGNGQFDLQMQRYCDIGPYAIGNIKKGTPRQNAATRENMACKRKSEIAAESLQIALDAMMNEPSEDDHPERTDDEKFYHKLGIKSSKQMFGYTYFGKDY